MINNTFMNVQGIYIYIYARDNNKFVEIFNRILIKQICHDTINPFTKLFSFFFLSFILFIFYFIILFRFIFIFILFYFYYYFFFSFNSTLYTVIIVNTYPSRFNVFYDSVLIFRDTDT